MRVPSNDTIVLSLADPGTAVTVGGATTGWLHGWPSEVATDALDGGEGTGALCADVVLEHAAASRVAASATVIPRELLSAL
jgi:hypothetical protein